MKTKCTFIKELCYFQIISCQKILIEFYKLHLFFTQERKQVGPEMFGTKMLVLACFATAIFNSSSLKMFCLHIIYKLQTCTSTFNHIGCLFKVPQLLSLVSAEVVKYNTNINILSLIDGKKFIQFYISCSNVYVVALNTYIILLIQFQVSPYTINFEFKY